MPDPSIKITLDLKGGAATEAMKKFGAVSKKAGEAVKVSLVVPLIKTQAILGGLKLGFSALKGTLDAVSAGFGEGGDQIAKLSEKLGISVEQLSLMKRQAELASVSFESLRIGATTLNKSIDDFSRGTGEAKIAFEEFGFTAADIAGPKFKNTTTAMETLADKFAELENGPKKTALAMKIFGEAGVDLIPLLNQGSDALREQRDEIEALGGIMTDEGAKKAVAFQDAMTKLQFAFDGIAGEIGAAVVPAITSLIEKFLDFFKRVREPMMVFVRLVPELFGRLFNRVKEIFEFGLDSDIVQKALDKITRLMDGFSQAFAVIAVDIWQPLLDAFIAIGLKIGEKATDLINSFIDKFNILRAKTLEVTGQIPAELLGQIQSARDGLADLEGGIKRLEIEERNLENAEKLQGDRFNENARKRLESVRMQLDGSREAVQAYKDQLNDLEQQVGGIDRIVFPDDMKERAAEAGERAAQGFSTAFATAVAALKKSTSGGPSIGEVLFGLTPEELDELESKVKADVQSKGEEIGKAFNDGVQAGVAGGTTVGGGDGGGGDGGGGGDDKKIANNFFAGFEEGIKRANEQLNDFAAQGLAAARDIIRGLGRAFDKFLFDVIDNGFDSIEDALRGLGQSILEMLKKLAIQQAVNAILGGITGGIGPAIGAAEGGVFRGIRPIPGFDDGGVITKPMIAAVGENAPGQEEAVVPLSRNREIPVKLKRDGDQSAGSARPVNITFEVSATDSQSFNSQLQKQRQTITNLVIEAMNTDNNLRRQVRNA